MAILTSLAVYVLSVFWTLAIGGWLSTLPLYIRAIITSTFVVFPLTYGVMAFVTKLFYKWLYPQSNPK
jgi:antibiotic biosynthesis monooxygenase (ABM) superfamily enzyme